MKGVRLGQQRRSDWLLEVSKADSEECIIWPFARDKAGYGRVLFMGRTMTANRAICIMRHGEPQSEKLDAAHTCGRGRDGCVSPNHVYWATRAKNLSDKKTHGTLYNNSKRLSVEAVVAIRSSDEKASILAARYGISASYVSMIQTGAKRIGGTLESSVSRPKHPARGDGCRQAKITEADVRRIRDDSRPRRLVAQQYGISCSAVQAIQERRNWKHVA